MKGDALSASGQNAWLRLARTPGVGPVTFAKLIERYKTADAALEALPALAKRGGRIDPLTIVSRDDAQAEMDAIENLGARLICSCEPGFPDLLSTLDPPPPAIITKGPLSLTDVQTCAIVGSRNASGIGMRFAGDLARELGRRGIITISGLARGIDGAAHAASLESGTVAVLAGGLARIYPPEHAELHEAIAHQGLLVSENPPHYNASARDFPRRNRLISGLSLGVVVVEAAERSGTLITARYALEQNREVMAVPGSPLDPRAKGTNRLLREGAALVETADDVIDVLNNARRPSLGEPSGFDYEDEQPDPSVMDREVETIREKLAGLLSPTPVSRDELTRQVGAPNAVVMAALVELEIAGRAELLPGGLVQIVYKPD